MPFPATSLPLHRRARSADTSEAVRNRYRQAQQSAGAQVRALQSAEAFIAEAQQWYALGCRDWFITSVILNIMLNLRLHELGVDLHQEHARRDVEARTSQLTSEVAGRVYPTHLFCGPAFGRMVGIFEVTALRSAGFELRVSPIDPELARTFLRNRLDFYAFDLPHAPLFGRPPGSWPTLD